MGEVLPFVPRARTPDEEKPIVLDDGELIHFGFEPEMPCDSAPFPALDPVSTH